MDALLIKTGGLLLIVALGYLLKRRGVFQQGDARLLSRIIVNLTLPGALLSSFSAFRLVPALLAVLAAEHSLGFFGSGFAVGFKVLIHRLLLGVHFLAAGHG